MPRWRAPDLPAAASYLACWLGNEARDRVAGLLASAAPEVPVTSVALPVPWGAAAEAELARPPAASSA